MDSMEYPILITDFDSLEDKETPLYLAIGVFDGVHVGHLAVIETAVLQAKISSGRAGVLTFDPHPSRLFQGKDGTDLIMNLVMKTERLHSVGIDVVIAKSFDHAFSSIQADSFLAHLCEQLPNLKGVCVGENFRFGNKRAGDVETLVASGNRLGIDVWSLDRIKQNGLPISSTRIRKSLEEGSIETVNALLGYNYFIRGVIESGQKLGRTIGFPTMNIQWCPECKPRYGVYAVQFRKNDSDDWIFGIANYGIRPTVISDQEPSPLLEIHSLEDHFFNLGDAITVELISFIRPEQKFNSVSELEEQIKKDCKSVSRLKQDGQ